MWRGVVWCGQVPRPHALRMACHNPTRPPMSQVSYLPYASVDVICACKCICICTHIHINSPQLHINVDQHIWTNFLNQVKLPVPFYPIWFANDPPRPSPAHHILLCFQNSIARSLDLAPSRSWLRERSLLRSAAPSIALNPSIEPCLQPVDQALAPHCSALHRIGLYCTPLHCDHLQKTWPDGRRTNSRPTKTSRGDHAHTNRLEAADNTDIPPPTLLQQAHTQSHTKQCATTYNNNPNNT